MFVISGWRIHYIKVNTHKSLSYYVNKTKLIWNNITKWKEVPATQVSCGPAVTHQPSMGGGHQPTMGGVISQVWGGHQPSMGGHQPTMGGHQPTMGGAISQVWGGSSTNYGGVISQVWGGSSTNYGGASANYGGASAKYGGVINQLWGGPSAKYGGGILPPVCTGSQNRENYFSNTYVLPSVNRTAGPTKLHGGDTMSNDIFPETHSRLKIVYFPYHSVKHKVFFHFHAVFRNVWPNNTLASLGVGTPPLGHENYNANLSTAP